MKLIGTIITYLYLFDKFEIADFLDKTTICLAIFICFYMFDMFDLLICLQLLTCSAVPVIFDIDHAVVKHFKCIYMHFNWLSICT